MPSATERLSVIRYKIIRAEDHLRHLDRALEAFINSRPYKVRAESHPETKQAIYYIDSVAETPFRIATIIGDVLQNLRSTLDHLVWELDSIGCAEKRLTLTDAEKRKVSFPITYDKTPQEYEATLKRKVKGMRDDALKKIIALNPYNGLNKTLWRLNELNNIDKHRFLLTAGLSLTAVSAKSTLPHGMLYIYGTAASIRNDYILPGNLLLIPDKPIYPLQKDTQLFVDIPGAEIDLEDYDKFRFQVAFSEPGIIEGEPVIPTLFEFRTYVNRIVLDFRDDLV